MLAEEKREREKRALLPALKDARVIIMTAMVFFWVFAIIGIGIWMPQILKSHGRLSNVQVGYLTSVPYLIGSVAMIPWARQVDRSRKYIKNFALAAALAAAGCVLSVLYASLLPAVIGMTAATIGISSMRPPFYAMPARFLTGAAAAGGLGFINGVGNLGGLVGPWVMGWLKDVTGFYAAGMFAMAAALLITVLLTLSLKLVVKEE
jgi:nitrate/nitrite transporter NarK